MSMIKTVCATKIDICKDVQLEQRTYNKKLEK